MKKILIITYYWPPSGGSGVQRWLKFVKYLPDFGIEPIILTVRDEDAAYALIDENLINDVPENTKVYKASAFNILRYYKRITKQKKLPHTGFASDSKSEIKLSEKIFRFIRGNFFIPDARKGWNKHAYHQALEIIKKHKISTVITTSPPHSSQLIGLKLKKKLNIEWIADLRDPWTDIYYYNELRHTGLARKIDANYEKQVLELADKVIVVSKSIKLLFLEKIRLYNPEKFHVISNGFDEDDIRKVNFDKDKKPSEWIISYTGNISPAYNPIVFLNAFKSLVEQSKDIKPIFRFIGTCHASILNFISKNQLESNFEHVSYVPHLESIAYLKSSDALFLAIPDVPKNEGILTGKLFEYLAVNKPILCLGPVNGDAAEIISDCQAGKTFDYSQGKMLEVFLIELYDNYCNNKSESFSSGRHLIYSRSELTRKLAEVIES